MATLRIFRIVQPKRRAEDVLEFSAFLTVIPNKSGCLLVTVIEAGVGGGGGHLPVLIIDKKMIIKKQRKQVKKNIL